MSTFAKGTPQRRTLNKYILSIFGGIVVMVALVAAISAAVAPQSYRDTFQQCVSNYETQGLTGGNSAACTALTPAQDHAAFSAAGLGG